MTWQLWSVVIIIAAFAADAAIGDPRCIPHPVTFIGKFIAGGERLMRRRFKPKTGGTLLAVLTMALCFLIPFAALSLLFMWQWLAAAVLELFFCWQIIAARSLEKAGKRVLVSLEKGDLGEARKYLSWIVGRDTGGLSQKEIIKATVETVAENTSDGVIAPLFYMFIGGAPLGFLYKGVNTLDSMLGYKNEKYIDFGRFAAKTDDVFNFIPAWVSGILMIAAAYLTGLNGKNAARIFKRDRKNHASPNSGKTEAAAAGALDIQLGGDAYYFGELYRKKTMGDVVREPEIEDIKRVNKLMYAASVLALAIFAGVKTAVFAAVWRCL